MDAAGTPEGEGRIALEANPRAQGLLLTTFALIVLGVVMVHSAVASVVDPGPWYVRRDVRHTLFAAVALVVLLLTWGLDYRRLAARREIRVRPDAGRGRRLLARLGGLPLPATCLLAGAMLATAAVFIPGVGHAVGGKLRWIRFGPPAYSIGFQPSEVLKVALMVFLAAWFTRPGADPRDLRRTVLPALAVIGASVGLVVTQDFGTAVILSLCGGGVLLLAGVRLRWLAVLAATGGSAGWFFICRSPYRAARITAMIDPWSTSNPSAYQPRQSLLAVLTGGLWGKGLGHGMLKRGYLPEGATDFIFSTFFEEWGLLGALLLMGLVLVWLWHARRATLEAPDSFGGLLCGSLGLLVGLQAVLHIAVDLVAAPPTGMGLPFVSAGGSALVMTGLAAAMMVSVTSRARPR